MKYGMSNMKTGRKRFGLYSNRFCISRILSGYRGFTNSVYTVFTTMCVAMAMNFLNLLSECWLVSCDYKLHYYVCGCELVCELVNYYHSLQLFVLLSFVYCFHVLMSGLLDDWVSYGSVCFRFDFRRPFVFNIYPFELVRFRYPVSPYSFLCSTTPFSTSFSY